MAWAHCLPPGTMTQCQPDTLNLSGLHYVYMNCVLSALLVELCVIMNNMLKLSGSEGITTADAHSRTIAQNNSRKLSSSHGFKRVFMQAHGKTSLKVPALSQNTTQGEFIWVVWFVRCVVLMDWWRRSDLFGDSLRSFWQNEKKQINISSLQLL